MSKAQAWRLALALCGLASLPVVLFVRSDPPGFALAGLVALAFFVAAERRFRRLASREQIRADLEDRLRNQD